jgi:hypothetical protein
MIPLDSMTELRSFAPSGIMEFWNSGFWDMKSDTLNHAVENFNRPADVGK